MVMWPVLVFAVVCSVQETVVAGPLKHSKVNGRSSPTLTTNAPDDTDESYRLPHTFVPYKYNLEIEPLMYEGQEENFSFQGRVRILMKCKNNTNQITLNANNLRINDSVQLQRFGTSEYYEVLRMTQDTQREFVTFSTRETLRAGRLYYLDISFTGPLRMDYRGLYLSYYQENGETSYLVTSQMEPNDARKAFPCFDEPQLKAVFEITLIRRQGYSALSNGIKTGETQLSGGRIADHFKATPKMSTYLVAMVVSKFKHVSMRTASGSEMRIWCKPADINNTQLALQDGVAIQDFFGDYLELDYPLAKQDQVEVPHFSFGAMENWGLIIYRPYLLIYDPQYGDLWWKKSVVETVAHELAHQWFGNIVTLHWWSDTWLNEGFANFFQFIGSGFRYPEWKQIEGKMVAHSVSRAFSSDNYASSLAMHEPISTRSEMIDNFGSNSYNKGGAILRMMQHFIGEETFRKGLASYLKKNSYRNVVPDDLWNAMGNQSQSEGRLLDVKATMDTWVYKHNHPVVTVTQDDQGRLHVSQKRFSITGDTGGKQDPSNVGLFWRIPFTYTTSRDRNFNKTHEDVIWIDQEEQVIETTSNQKDDWIIGNVQRYGFYRVNYDENNWIRLAEQLTNNREVIHAINREYLQNDAYALSRSGDISDTIYEKISEAARGEQNAAVLETAVSGFREVKNILAETKVEKKFKKFVQDVVGKQYSENGLSSTPQNIEDEERKRVLVEVACEFELEECVNKAVDMYAKWMADVEASRIPLDVQKTVFCTAIANGAQTEWEFAYVQYKNTENSAERLNLIDGMACSRRSDLLDRYLERSINPREMSIVDGVRAIDQVSDNSVGRRFVWQFLSDNWDKIEDRFGKDSLPLEKLLEELSGSFHTENDLKQIKSFQAANKGNMGSARMPFKQDLERTKSNMKWMERSYHTVEKWMNSR